MWRLVGLVTTNVSEKHVASIFRVEINCEQLANKLNKILN
jgi:hypothetical protein